ncbi:MAG TPA: proline racemase family protein [Candidatus Limnocylindrales bacterium]|nr:proline racemase family protein [Candidatus Limnocylindrales bacterium]
MDAIAAPSAPGIRKERRIVTTTDYHTAGEPFRIVTGGVPPLEGRTVLDRRRFARDHLDDVRRLLVNEPRGHADMYGAFVVPPNDVGADLGVVFFHNEGYSTACGHGTIALVTWALESGRLPITGDATHVVVDVPSGRLDCVADTTGGRARAVRFRNVPSFALARSVEVDSRAFGRLSVDVAFGGAFYGSLDVRTIGLDVSPASLPRVVELERELRQRLESAVDVAHPDEPELRGIYGVIFWQEEAPTDGATLTQRNVTVFADGEVDRSPCGSGTSARLALLHADGRLGPGERLRHLGIVGSAFIGSIVGETTAAGRAAVVTEVEGSAFLTGRHQFVLEPDDPLATGFLLR